MGVQISLEQFSSKAIAIQYMDADGARVSSIDIGLRSVEFDPKPFSHGKFREAFHGKVFVDDGHADAMSDETWKQRLSCWVRYDGGKPYYRCVVKTFRRGHALRAAEWSQDLTVLLKASQLANKYTKSQETRPALSSDSDVRMVEIRFARAFLYQVVRPGKEQISKRHPFDIFGINKKTEESSAAVQRGDKICVEPFLTGKFVKANCNNGYVRECSGNGDADRVFLDAAQAFSHWTWTVTDGELLICDLQGVCSEKGGCKIWEFTDPAIHCSAGTQRFGVTDLGPRGINAFFSTHKCNALCRHLKRPGTIIDFGMPPTCQTTFSFELVRVSAVVHCQQDFADIANHCHSGTCYAHAVATIVRAAESRIVGRRLELHHIMVQRLVSQFGTKGINSNTVLEILKQVCDPRRLRFKVVSADEACAALDLGHAVMVSFYLSQDQWSYFSARFRDQPRAVLDHIPEDGTVGPAGGSGHAAVIVGRDQDEWKIKNSWGDDFADEGFFRVRKDALPELRLYHVFFLEADLTPADVTAYHRHCSDALIRTC